MKNKIYWITGLAGSGKTTIAKILSDYLKTKNKRPILLDGDELRKIFKAKKNNFSLNEREKLSFQYSMLAKILNEQGFDVIISTISMFHKVRSWNRRNLRGYVEIFINTPIEILIKRNKKGLYSRAIKGNIKNVIGVDLPVQLPKSPDIILLNDNTKSVNELFSYLVSKLKIK